MPLKLQSSARASSYHGEEAKEQAFWTQHRVGDLLRPADKGSSGRLFNGSSIKPTSNTTEVVVAKPQTLCGALALMVSHS